MKILLPVDGSALSLHEIRFAMQLLQQGLQASFVLVNVQEPASFYEIITARNDQDMLTKVQTGAGTDMLAPAAELLQQAGIAHDIVVLRGDPVQAMLDIIDTAGIDLVVMGSRALGPLRAMLEGSTSLQLVHASPVPVLLVKPPVDAD